MADDGFGLHIYENVETIVAILKGQQEPPGGWSSLIGIVTAIVGNVLISFALNTQRYAHLRIQRAAGEDGGDGSRAATPTQGDYHRSREQDRRSGRNEARYRDEPETHDDGDGDNGNYHDDDDAEDAGALLPMAKKDNASITSSRSRSSSDDGEPRQKSYLKSPYWWLGIALMVVGEAGNFLAYGFAPASIVSPLGVVALISNCIIAPIMLREKFRKRDALGVLIAVGGAVTVVLSAEGSNPKLGPDQIWHMVKRWEFLTYLAITVVLAVALMLLSNRYGKKTILIDLGLVGLFGGYTALSTKGVSSLLSYRLWRVVTFPIFYLLVAVLVGTAVMQIKYVNRALQRFDSTQVIPVQFVIFTISVIVGSAILYRDFEKTTKENLIQFLGGCALTFLGVWFITSGRRDEHGESDDEHDEEQGITLVDDEAMYVDRSSASPPSTPRPAHGAVASLRANAADSPASFATASSNLDTPPHSRFLTATKSSPSVPRQASTRVSSSLPPSNDSSDLLTTAPSPGRRPRTQQTSSDPRTPSVYTTPAAAGHGSLLTPDASANADRAARKLWPRHSISSLVNPKALTSPLSAGLSAVVADSLRRTQSNRGTGLRRTSTVRSRKGSGSASRALNISALDGPAAELQSGDSSVADSSALSSRRTSTADADATDRGKAPRI